ncbi:MAG: hypothetical protein ABID61_05875 [Candidatus Micrarchaeota archaeon]
MSTEQTKDNYLITLGVWAVLGIIIGLGIYFVFLTAPSPIVSNSNNTNVTPLPSQPVSTLTPVTAYLITQANCNNCSASGYLLDSFISAESQFSFNVTKKVLVSTSSEAQSLISKYKITKLPVMLVSSSAANSSQFESAWLGRLGTKESDGMYVYRSVYPPYYDSSLGKAVGYVNVYHIVPTSCTNCTNTTEFIQFLTSDQVLMLINSETVLSQNSSKAQELISKYNITKLPTVLLSPDATYYPIINTSWNTSGTFEKDGWLIYRNVLPPYLDLTTNQTRGLINVVKLVDGTCSSCYNVTSYLESLATNFYLQFANTTTYDINSTNGKLLVAKYNITAVPTFLFSEETKLYANLGSLWTESGNTIESDGWFVFRTLDNLGSTYKNLTTGNITVGTTVSS